MNERIVHKGNVTKKSYDVRITETDGKEYYYHFSCHGDYKICSIWILHNNLFNLRREREESWDKLPFEVKEKHYKEIYPNDDLDEYEKNCFFYGKEKADEIIASEKKKEALINKAVHDDEICSYTVARRIYEKVGPWNSIELIYQKGLLEKFYVDDKIVTVERLVVISVENKADYEAKRKQWGQRIRRIANEAGTSFEMATVIGKITDDLEARVVLKEVVEELKSAEFEEHMKNRGYFSQYSIYDDRNFVEDIRDFLRPKYWNTNLNISNKFRNEVKKILNNKK